MTHDPRDVETVARLVCTNWDQCQTMRSPICRNCREAAVNVLDALQDKGWKITARGKDDDITGPTPWTRCHDAAPMVPHELALASPVAPEDAP